MIQIRISTALFIIALVTPALAGPFPPAAGQPGSDAIAAADVRFTTWATGCVVERGPSEIGYEGSTLATYGNDAAATGPSDATPDSPYPVVSLGDGGTATLEYLQPFGDVPGPDFAVFENGFGTDFLELAHVEVSSDSVNFFRFPSTSLTVASATLGEGGSVDPSNVRNLAGKYIASFGTPFDLAELRNVSPLLDIQRITHVRVIDVIGTNDPALASFDAEGHLIIDPYPTPYFSGGFDLDALGAFSQTSTIFAAWKTAQGIIDPDPAADSNHDGVPNIIEYLTGTGRVSIGVSGGSCTVSFRRLAYRADGNLRLEGSTDLVHWAPLALSDHGASMTSTAPGVSIIETGTAALQTTITLPGNAAWKFFRLAAEP
ncbi:MAG: hypothetical protein WEB53_13385 [Akkermansiaceae bacterium]